MNLEKKISRLESIHNFKVLWRYRNRAPKYKCIFVLGAPRCGSTLFYQAMVHRYKFSYFQNRMMKHIFSVASYTQRHIDPNEVYHPTFESVHGATFNPTDPNEGSVFWRRFYPRQTHDYIPDHNHLSPWQMREIRSTIAFLTAYFDRPFFSKNLEMSLRLHSLQHLFPDALYIVIKRDPRSIASSILNARLKLYDSQETWWSMRPKEYEQLIDKAYHEQIAYQITCIYKAIYADLKPSNNTMEVYYEDFCEAPKDQSRKVIDFCKSNGLDVMAKREDLPEKFAYKKTFSFTKEALDSMHDVFSQNNLMDILQYKIN